MTHAKLKVKPTPWAWGPDKPGKGRTLNRKRGPNFKLHPKLATPYAAGTHAKLLDRYLKILNFLQKRLAVQAGPITTIRLGEYMELTAAATGISCHHLADYLTRHGLEARKILQRSVIKGMGVSWEGRDSIGMAMELIQQHMRQVPK